MSKLKLCTAENWKKEEDQQKENGILKHFNIEDINEKDIRDTADGLIVPFIISTSSIDRDGDTISIDGWDLKNYKKNPVVLYMHDPRNPPVAKSMNIKIEDGKLKSEAQFTPQDLNPFGYMIGQMYKKGFMKATSVGFKATKWTWAEDKDRKFGIDFIEQELLEYSAVPIPANPEALLDAKSNGLDVLPAYNWACELLEKGLVDNKDLAEKIYAMLKSSKTIIIGEKQPNTQENIDGVNAEEISALNIKILNLKKENVTL